MRLQLIHNVVPKGEDFRLPHPLRRFLIALAVALMVGVFIGAKSVERLLSEGSHAPDAGQGEGVLLAMVIGLCVPALPILFALQHFGMQALARRGLFGILPAVALACLVMAIPGLPLAGTFPPEMMWGLPALTAACFGPPLGITYRTLLALACPPAFRPAILTRDETVLLGIAGLGLAAGLAVLALPMLWEALGAPL